jgi:carboxyl-terminal processing protease
LVQEQNEWTDGSATRLTVARYYTPNGRSIQKPYESLSSDGLGNPDSALGGIIPDVLVERDTTGVTWLFAELVHAGTLMEFAYAYRDRHYDTWKKLNEYNFESAVTDEEISAALRVYLENSGKEINESEWNRSIARMTLRIKALIARSLFGDQLYYKILNQEDPFVKEAWQQTKKPMSNSPAS